MYPSITESLIRAINSWNPKVRGAEPKFRDDLINYLRNKFGHQFSITKEAGRGLCDISVSRQVGIELKKDLKTKSQIDRLIGQVVEYQRQYQEVIIVLVGKTNKDALDKLRESRNHLLPPNDFLGNAQKIPIMVVDKNNGMKPVKKQQDVFSNPKILLRPFG